MFIEEIQIRKITYNNNDNKGFFINVGYISVKPVVWMVLILNITVAITYTSHADVIERD